MSRDFSRRSFFKTVGLSAAGYWAATNSWTGTSATARAASPNEKLKIAVVGLGRQGSDDISDMLHENIVAIADVDHGYMMKKAGKMIDKFPKVKLFEDFRVMFDTMENQIDAVVVATPDHVHFHPAWSAMQRGKHLYQEKPLAHNVWEVRQLTNLARNKKLATQLGVQRHVHEGLRNGVELVRSGVLGNVKEVYSWMGGPGRGGNWTKITEPPTDKLNWDLWLGPTEHIPYRDGLAHYDFRFWWKYGTGDAGNFGCHVLDVPYWALDLKYPKKVTSSSKSTPGAERTPTDLSATFEFPATDRRPGLTLHWHQDDPKKVAQVAKEHKLTAQQMKGINNLFIGEKGMLLCGYNQDSLCHLLPEKNFADVKPTGTMFEKSPGFRQEWINACKGSTTAPTCQFDYSGPLTETILLANVAYRIQGSFNWNAEKMEADNPKASQYLREAYRKGWEV
jgi:predicted dehydrogenase